MKKRMALIAGGVALTAAAAIPAGWAFACPPISPHCQKVAGALDTASSNLGSTPAGSQNTNAQGSLMTAGGTYLSIKC